MARYLVPVILFAVMIPIFMIGLQRDPTELPSPYIDNPAPEFELPRLRDANATVGSADYAGSKALVNVWATWCVGCRQEHDFLMSLAAEGEIPIYGLNWRDRRPDALRWLEQLGDPYVASAFDADGRVAFDWGVYGAPETFLVDEEGIVLHKHIGPLNRTIWERDFAPKIDTEPEVSR
ncbi:MAG: DsbE family thiol:disulfide interchange protein [Proteobacteria bacterium]|nr:DsbE family thiol:disulfide interchange protein [Pseudomonadota bacterium]